MKKPKIGFMQGRLLPQTSHEIQSFPGTEWEKEFEKASKIGFEVMEWIFDDHGKNPLLTDEGVDEIKSFSKKFDISINSVCADYFMEKKLFGESEDKLKNNVKVLSNLITQSKKLGISFIEIPLVDSSSLITDNNKLEFKKNIDEMLPLAKNNGITIVLETDLNPIDFRNYLLEFDHSNIKANYDSGNSASLGYNVEEELDILKDWIANVHIKDRKLHGGTVPLGSGDTNFEQFFSSLFKINYTNDLIIQGARIVNNEEMPENTCKSYLKFVKEYVDRYYT